MTLAQQRMIERIKKDIPYFDFYHSDDYEIKSFEIEENERGTVMVYFVTGMKNDIGTMAQALCRKKRMCWIGKKGGIKVLNNNHNLVSVSEFDLMNKFYRF